MSQWPGHVTRDSAWHAAECCASQCGQSGYWLISAAAIVRRIEEIFSPEYWCANYLQMCELLTPAWLSSVKEGDGVRIGYCCGPTGGWCGGVQILVCVCILNVCNFKTNCQPSPAAGAGLVKTSRATSSSCQLLPEPELLMLTTSVLQFWHEWCLCLCIELIFTILISSYCSKSLQDFHTWIKKGQVHVFKLNKVSPPEIDMLLHSNTYFMDDFVSKYLLICPFISN